MVIIPNNLEVMTLVSRGEILHIRHPDKKFNDEELRDKSIADILLTHANRLNEFSVYGGNLKKRYLMIIQMCLYIKVDLQFQSKHYILILQNLIASITKNIQL